LTKTLADVIPAGITVDCSTPVKLKGTETRSPVQFCAEAAVEIAASTKPPMAATRPFVCQQL
jgi:hypothetical protein